MVASLLTTAPSGPDKIAGFNQVSSFIIKDRGIDNPVKHLRWSVLQT